MSDKVWPAVRRQQSDAEKANDRRLWSRIGCPDHEKPPLFCEGLEATGFGCVGYASVRTDRQRYYCARHATVGSVKIVE